MNIFSSIIRSLGIKGVAKGTTVSAQATVTTVDADHNALDVTVIGTPALPADAARETKQDTGNGFLSTLAGIVSAGKAAISSTQLPAALGITTASGALPIVFARSLPATSATLAINGEVIKASAGSALWITITNTTGSSVYWQIHDLASGPPGAGARAAASAPAITANNGSRTGDPIGPTLGLGCSTGILLVLSLSPTTYSAVASNSCSYSIQYI